MLESTKKQASRINSQCLKTASKTIESKKSPLSFLFLNPAITFVFNSYHFYRIYLFNMLLTLLKPKNETNSTPIYFDLSH